MALGDILGDGTEDRMMSTKEIAKMFGVTSRTVVVWIEAGKLKAFKGHNHLWRCWRSDVLAFGNLKYGDPQ